MGMIALFSAMVGAVLGVRYRVQVLFPVTVLVLASIFAIATLKGSTVSATVATGLACSVALQLGYLGGLLTRFCLAAARLTSRRVEQSNVVRS